MSRDIKFRAWDKFTKLLVNLIGFKDLATKIELWYWNKENEIGHCVADKEYIEVIQYTGLKDKNDKEIYEGDIVKSKYANCINDEHIQKVVFEDGRFALTNKKENIFSPLSISKHLTIDKSVYLIEVEVIGNIYENPELLKE